MTTTVSPTTTTRPDTQIVVSRRANAAPVSKTLYGLFLEDINFAADGGLNANVVNNWSFEGGYLNRSGGYSQLTLVAFKLKPKPVTDALRHWSTTGGTLSALSEGGATAGANYARLSVRERATLTNNGYPGPGPSMGGRAGVAMQFSALVRTARFRGQLSLALVDGNGTVVTGSEVVVPDGDGWSTATAALTPPRTGLYGLQIVATGNGEIDLDDVSLIAEDHWGAGDPRWSQGRLRRDLVQSLVDLSPGFLRFPGGCIVEGVGDGNQYDWKQTVGPLHDRTPKFNLWAESRPDGDYSQSNQIGFYEYFLLCEDLDMEPVPVVWAGLACQYRSRECVATHSAEFKKVVQDAVDLIDWATGDPAESPWAALRAAAGHPEPFRLNYVGIGNENHGDQYHRHFDAILDALEAVRPGMRYILASGPFPKGKPFEGSWAHATNRSNVILDEHSYAKPSWFIDQSTRYDSYPRTGARVMVGEYAAHPAYSLSQMFGRDTSNSWESAVAEAAFLTGVERNADLVEMTCYAPLFALNDAKQWRHNMIEFTQLLVQPTVNYEIQRLFGEAVGAFALTADVDGEGVFASATGDDELAFVKIVNTTDRPRTVTLRFSSHTATHAEVVHLSAAPHARTRISSVTSSSSPLQRRDEEIEIRRGAVELTLQPASVARVSLKEQGPERPDNG
ncbi:alpha-L-arabinofuranosidase C-terminal domain-containing protein [Microbacterium sp. RURRCA19A]|uniref:alpha-L-arabinofuranosidase C-terminal domain-containing protein n=1 Tax=Microbacterium sp. RURRCA19A TaxID=1907391 RepID=UPI000954479B|nr:alpha-L-arabinofuranosidase C-terminal domain-containing protein [Microbacterium sp. RURRCA19A]SIS09109.1 Alpha-L-arabinofuranosidase C-terminus [Microbacterium sp. RURRCA19A]